MYNSIQAIKFYLILLCMLEVFCLTYVFLARIVYLVLFAFFFFFKFLYIAAINFKAHLLSYFLGFPYFNTHENKVYNQPLSLF